MSGFFSTSFNAAFPAVAVYTVFGVLGFSLVVLAAKSNVPLAAVPVIYTNVHFCAAVLTEKQAG